MIQVVETLYHILAPVFEILLSVKKATRSSTFSIHLMLSCDISTWPSLKADNSDRKKPWPTSRRPNSWRDFISTQIRRTNREMHRSWPSVFFSRQAAYTHTQVENATDSDNREYPIGRRRANSYSTFNVLLLHICAYFQRRASSIAMLEMLALLKHCHVKSPEVCKCSAVCSQKDFHFDLLKDLKHNQDSRVILAHNLVL